MSARSRPGATAWLLAVYVFLYVPILCLIVFSFTAGEITTQFDGFSLRWYAELARDAELIDAVLLSLRVGALAATAAVVVGTAAAFVLARFGRYPGSAAFAGMTTAPMVMPEVVIGLSLVLLFTHPLFAFLGGRGVAAIWAAHTTLCTAYVTVLVQSRLREMDRSLEEAALDLGCPPFKVFFVITVPVIAPALMAGWLLAFTLSMDDFVLAAMLSDPGSTTLPVLVFARLHHGLKPEINALATVIVAVVSLAVVVANRAMLSAQRTRAAALRHAAGISPGSVSAVTLSHPDMRR
ncbi:MAG: putrescine transport system permease protein [Azoarcus sp.]|uniref:Putrescine transport system permease protein n=1 Tax=Aromatoleum tolulyticum TaxID=34027 RepID=A0A1N7BY49_9RHOO|nr:ABC transporter permease subunit [Aromatoleum tolulyticum]MCK9987489.1 putrescine transport system permease protein [Azoarcus sp.]SIR56259.1 putrescine transport system permease protein [Aromatoleum tolulyticum]